MTEDILLCVGFNSHGVTLRHTVQAWFLLCHENSFKTCSCPTCERRHVTSRWVMFRQYPGGQRGQGMDDVLRHIDVPWPLEMTATFAQIHHVMESQATKIKGG